MEYYQNASTNFNNCTVKTNRSAIKCKSLFAERCLKDIRSFYLALQTIQSKFVKDKR